MSTCTPPPGGHAFDRPVPVSELFYSFQGEGVNLGRRALFVRFAGCNLTCGYATAPASADVPADGKMLCDTEYTWNRAKYDLAEGVRYLTPQGIWAELVKLDPATTRPSLGPVDLVVASGGEPLLRKHALLHLAVRARMTGRRMEIETNATIRPGADLAAAGVAFNAGLKLATSAVPRAKRIKADAIAEIQASGQARWKFVFCGPEDLAEIAALQAEFALTEVWLSPAGTCPAAVLEQMRLAAGPALEHGWNLTTREHVLIWGDERGR
jgi:7-carboxy-7-deazaguanine synthase